MVLLVIKIVSAINNGENLSEILHTLRDGIFDNILGILPPILLFDFWLEYLQQDKIFDEMTEQITGTIMSKPEVIQSFDKEAQERFLNATVLALVDQDEDECSMALGAINPYINDKFDIRKDFTYYLEIRNCENIENFCADKYMLLCENLSYELFYIASEPIGDTVTVGFFVENAELDKRLREQKELCHKSSRYIMREGLDIDPSDFEKIKAYSSDKATLQKYISSLFVPQLYIDDELWAISDIDVCENRIDIDFKVLESRRKGDEKSSKISLSFRMPQLKTNTSFLASISQPTYNPTIRLSYPEDKYNVKIFPFFNSTVGPSVSKAEQVVGSRNIQVKNKWVHPMSGVVFLINSIE